jgi:phage anti-repressor protein
MSDNISIYELIPIRTTIINGKKVAACHAKDIYNYVGKVKRFVTWLKELIEKYGFVKDKDFIVVGGINAKYPALQNMTENYIITMYMARELCKHIRLTEKQKATLAEHFKYD